MALHDIKPVSYTHLDVYKRQDPGRRQVHVGQQAEPGGQQPANPVGFVAEQRRPAQVEEGGKGDVGAEGQGGSPASVVHAPFSVQTISATAPTRTRKAKAVS